MKTATQRTALCAVVLREVELYKKMQTHENRTDQACRASQTTTVSQTTPGP